MPDRDLTDGTSQDDRYDQALDDDFFPVDGLTFDPLLSMSAELSRTLGFTGPDNRRHGDWSGLFTSDETVVMAMIACFDLKGHEDRLLMKIMASPGRNAGFTLDLCRDVLGLAEYIDFWLEKLRIHDGVAAVRLRQGILNIIEKKLAREYGLLMGLVDAISKRLPAKDQVCGFRPLSPVWQQDKEHRTGPQAGDIDGETSFISDRFYAFRNGIQMIKKLAVQCSGPALTHAGHDPAIGLFIAFLKLREKARERINTFKKRHRDFYYRDILKVRPKPGMPDKTFLALGNDEGGPDILVQKGTGFIGGKDPQGADRVYEAENDLVVRDIRVQRLATLFLEKNGHIFPENALGFVTGVKHSIWDAGGDGLASGHPVFGASRDASASEISSSAVIGLAVASPVLFLEQGDRKVTLTLHVRTRWGQGKQDLADLYDALAGHLNTNPRDALEKAFGTCFIISLTTPNGWCTVKDYHLGHRLSDLSRETHVISVTFRLPAAAAPVTAYNPAVHGYNFRTSLPVLSLAVNHNAYVNPYSFFTHLDLEQVNIEVDVKDMKHLIVHNTHGRIATDTPFYLFGPIPTPESFFLVGNWEIAQKQLTDFSVHVEWGELPGSAGGFAAHYSAYDHDVTTSSFQVETAILNEGRWIVETGGRNMRAALFREDSETRIEKRTRLSGAGFVHSRASTLPGSPGDFSYSLDTRSGFFKFTLVEPAFAFGHAVYPACLAKRLMENVKIKKTSRQKALPNMPYAPLVKSMTVDYRAEARIDCTGKPTSAEDPWSENVFHVFPGGSKSLLAADSGKVPSLIPMDLFEGNLYIGLSGPAVSGRLALFFRMNDDSRFDMDAVRPRLRWFYLASNRWKAFNHFDVISDTTHGFLSSGIVTLNIPSDIDRHNTILPDDVFWLRVSADRIGEAPPVMDGKEAQSFQKSLRCLCSLVSITPNGVSVVRSDKGEDPGHSVNSLPSGSIRELRVSIPGIRTVRQLIPSFGGMSGENDRSLARRTSERLRHKNRAVSSTDYERLILERFPGIYKVKCFPNMHSGGGVAQGHVLIVVVPRIYTHRVMTDQGPMVNGLMLNDIAEYVKGHASPFAHIDVRNPVYEKVQVRCTVALVTGCSGGEYVKKLNEDINGFLDPWAGDGFNGRFGGVLRHSDVESFIGHRDYIDFVTNLSMLHIVDDGDERYAMEDTVAPLHRPSAEGESRASGLIRSVFPWSIMIPVSRHFIEITEQRARIQAEVTGVDELEVGRTLIIGKEAE